MRSSARRSSSTARRDTTMLPRRRSIFRIWNSCGWFISGPTSRIGRTSTWRSGKERDRAVEIDGEAALDAAEDHALHAGSDSLNAFSSRIQLSSRRALSRRQHRFAQRILDALQIDLDLVADLMLAGMPGIENSLRADAALGLQADIDHGVVVLDGDDRALDDGAFLRRLGEEAVFEHGREIFAGGRGDGGGVGHSILLVKAFVPAGLASLGGRTSGRCHAARRMGFGSGVLGLLGKRRAGFPTPMAAP